MSPLIDVTNTVPPDIPKDVQDHFKSSSTNEFEPKNAKDLTSHTTNDSPCSQSKITKDASITTKCNKPKVSHRKKKRSRSWATCISKDKNPELQVIKKPEFPHRVPPLPSDHLTQAFTTLNLSQDKIESNLMGQTGSISQAKRNLEDACKCRLTGTSNKAGPPSNSFSSTYQCVACLLEFSTMQNLTGHLVKHIYEGLHAASWLSTAMSLLVSPSISDITNSGVTNSDINDQQLQSSESITDSGVDSANS